MKIESTLNNKEFKPITVSLTFQTQEEINEFCAIFNTRRITSNLQNIDHRTIREYLYANHNIPMNYLLI